MKNYKQQLTLIEEFIKEVGLRPNKDYSIDRINNNIGYFKGNIK